MQHSLEVAGLGDHFGPWVTRFVRAGRFCTDFRQPRRCGGRSVHEILPVARDNQSHDGVCSQRVCLIFLANDDCSGSSELDTRKKKSLSRAVLVLLPGQKNDAFNICAHIEEFTSAGVALKSEARIKGIVPWSVSAISSPKSSLASGDFMPSRTYLPTIRIGWLRR